MLRRAAACAVSLALLHAQAVPPALAALPRPAPRGALSRIPPLRSPFRSTSARPAARPTPPAPGLGLALPPLAAALSPAAAPAALSPAAAAPARAGAALALAAQVLSGAPNAPRQQENALSGLFDSHAAPWSGAGLPRLESGAEGEEGLPKPYEDRKARLAALKTLKSLLDGGTSLEGRRLEPFSFRKKSGGWNKARSAGLEGFLYSKLEHERSGESSAEEEFEDYLRYLETLTAPTPWAALWRERLDALRRAALPASRKNEELNALLLRSVKGFQKHMSVLDASLWLREASIYMVLARAYNRLKPGRNFFDSLDEEELSDIRKRSFSDVLWLLDIFEIGLARRWGTGGGSPYALRAYRVKSELGGDEALKRFARRAKAQGLRPAVDEVPNHVALDGDLVEQAPEALLHVVPPQPEPGEAPEAYSRRILDAVPREEHPPHAPLFYLTSTRRYPGRLGETTWILLHHPRTDDGEITWVDMAQRDFTQSAAREWETREARRLYEEFGIELLRRDMAYFVLNAGYHERWLRMLARERDSTSGWMREKMDALIASFRERWERLGGEEFLERMSDEIRLARPDGTQIDEAYGFTSELSRAGSGGVYNKNDHDASMGQVGLYDALRSRDPARVRAALRHAAFRRWQRGGAAAVNFIGTHDGGEGNPVDVFGPFYEAAAALTLPLRPILLYNGVETGVGQKRMLLGDLSKSQDTAKAIPFDVPVSIDWSQRDPARGAFLRRLLDFGRRNAALLGRGAMEVLEPESPSPLVAWSAGSEDFPGRAVLVAANLSDKEAWAHFRLGDPLLKAFGAFLPRAERVYALRDHARLDASGKPTLHIRSGKALLEEGLHIGLKAHEAHFFEIEELEPGAEAAFTQPAGFSPEASPLALSFVGSGAGCGGSGPERGWDSLTRLLNLMTLPIFTGLQIPQILKNFSNLLSGNLAPISILPWVGYATGVLANLILLSFFISVKDKTQSWVQGLCVLASSVVLSQIALAGFMPAAAFFLILPSALAALALNALRAKGRLRDASWSRWLSLSAWLGAAALPQAVWSAAGGSGFWPALLAAAGGLALWALAKAGHLSERVLRWKTQLGPWLATGLFLCGQIAQVVFNIRFPSQMAGIALGTLLLGMSGNLLALPRAMITKNRIWFAGSFCGVALGGLAVLAQMALGGAAPWPLALGAYLGTAAFLAWMLKSTQAYFGYASARRCLDFLFTMKKGSDEH